MPAQTFPGAGHDDDEGVRERGFGRVDVCGDLGVDGGREGCSVVGGKVSHDSGAEGCGVVGCSRKK